MNLMENSCNTRNSMRQFRFFSGFNESKLFNTTKSSPLTLIDSFSVRCKKSKQFQFVNSHAKQLCLFWTRITRKVAGESPKRRKGIIVGVNVLFCRGDSVGLCGGFYAWAIDDRHSTKVVYL